MQRGWRSHGPRVRFRSATARSASFLNSEAWPPSTYMLRFRRSASAGRPRGSAASPGPASGTNLASIGYHYGSTKALLNAAVLAAMEDFGAEMAKAIGDPDPGPGALIRFERFWTRVINSFQASSQVWLATFDIFTVAQRDPEVRAAVADGLEDGRRLWARLLYGVDDADEDTVRAIGSMHQALVSGVLVQWLIDPGRAPSPAQLALGLKAIADQVASDSQPS